MTRKNHAGSHKPIVLVIWEDSAQPTGNWQWIDNIPEPDAAAAALIGNPQQAASGLGGIVGTAGTAIGQITAAAPARLRDWRRATPG